MDGDIPICNTSNTNTSKIILEIREGEPRAILLSINNKKMIFRIFITYRQQNKAFLHFYCLYTTNSYICKNLLTTHYGNYL